LRREFSTDELESRYLRLYKGDSTEWPEAVFRVLDDFFFDVDDYVADDALRAEVGGIDAEQLRVKAEQALQRLDELVPPER
jgi:hypothetical protein